MELVVKVRQQNILLKIFFGNVSVSNRLSYERQFLFSDLDECTLNLHNCNDQAMCNNTLGSFSCACNTGWTGNGTSCEGTAKELTVATFFLLNFSCKIDCHICGNVLLQMWMNACLILMTVMTRQCATTLQVHFHALVTTLGQEMELVVRVCERNALSNTIFPPKFFS